jgi:hypothetical protein
MRIFGENIRDAAQLIGRRGVMMSLVLVAGTGGGLG